MLRRWSSASKLFTLLAIACAAIAFTTVRGYERRLEALRPDVGAPVPVVVAARDLERGAVLDAGALEVAQVPSRFSPPGAFAAAVEVEGRVLVTDVVAGEAVTATRLASADVGPVAALVPPGMRAFPLSVAVPARSVRAGDAVDVLATFGGRQPHTETVVSGVDVLSVVQQTGTALATDQAAVSLVVLVSPQDAERLAFASAFASLAVTFAPADPT